MCHIWANGCGKPELPQRREGPKRQGRASLRKQELGSWENMSLGGEAGPGLEGPHVPCDGIFGLFQKACRGNNRDQEMAFFFF